MADGYWRCSNSFRYFRGSTILWRLSGLLYANIHDPVLTIPYQLDWFSTSLSGLFGRSSCRTAPRARILPPYNVGRDSPIRAVILYVVNLSTTAILPALSGSRDWHGLGNGLDVHAHIDDDLPLLQTEAITSYGHCGVWFEYWCLYLPSTPEQPF